jgi:hypothetical protein
MLQRMVVLLLTLQPACLIASVGSMEGRFGGTNQLAGDGRELPTNRCGSSYHDATHRCGIACPSGADAECGTLSCFTNLDPTVCGKAAEDGTTPAGGAKYPWDAGHEAPVKGEHATGADLTVLADQLLSRFIIIPEHKLLFCYIEKVRPCLLCMGGGGRDVSRLVSARPVRLVPAEVVVRG